MPLQLRRALPRHDRLHAEAATIQGSIGARAHWPTQRIHSPPLVPCLSGRPRARPKTLGTAPSPLVAPTARVAQPCNPAPLLRHDHPFRLHGCLRDGGGVSGLGRGNVLQYIPAPSAITTISCNPLSGTLPPPPTLNPDTQAESHRRGLLNGWYDDVMNRQQRRRGRRR